MPSPFPGINPYIESRGLWGDFHQRLITGTGDALNGQLPEHYAARIEEQVRLDSPVHLVEIDLLVGGSRPPMSHNNPWPAGEYYALISKAEDRPDCRVYGWSVRRPIPIPIPLAAPDPRCDPRPRSAPRARLRTWSLPAGHAV
jgi:hypothetical protein